ncbi:MAG TPA: oligosaccharide flippase family protein [Terracidiphilus sp.]|jgi:O-antigen/teichoic acid export membrane protein
MPTTSEFTAASASKDIAPAEHGRGIRAVGQTIVSRILIQGLNAVTGIFTARMLLPEGRGQLAAITLWSSLLAGLTTFGLPSALIYHIRNRPKQTGSLLASALAMTLLLSSIAAGVGAFCMPHWLHLYPTWGIRAAQWFLLVTPLCAATLILRGALEANGAFSLSNLAQLLNPAVTLALLLFFFATHRFDTITASLAYILAALPVFLLLVWQARYLFDRLSWPSIAASKLLLSYGIRSYGIDLLGTLALQVDQVIVVSFLKASDLGLYVVMLSLSRMLNVFQTSVVMVLFPKAAGRTHETAIALTARAARVSTSITGVCAIALMIVGPLLLRIFYGREYARSVGCLRLLLLEVTISGCVFVLAQAFMALGRPGVVTFLQAVGLSLSLPIMLLLIPRWGIQGAAVALLASTCARFIFIYTSFRVVLKVKAPSLLPRKEDFFILLTALRRLKKVQPA